MQYTLFTTLAQYRLQGKINCITISTSTTNQGHKMTKQQKEMIKQLKAEINSPKHRLLEILRRIEEISPSESDKMGRIIWKLEVWQNK
jgi:hypothetical protein